MKSILSMLLAITMVCMHATAQNTVTNINTEDPQACAQYLIQNPLDTIVSYTNLSADSVIVYKVFFKNGVVSQDALMRKTIKFSLRQEEKSDTIASNAYVNDMAQFLLSGASNDGQYDIYWVQTSAGPVPVKWGKKYGLHVQVGVGCSLTKENFSPDFSLGVLYDRAKWGVLLEGEVAQTQLSSNAEHAGDKYWIYRTQATLRYRPFRLDANDVNRLFVYGGLGWEYYKTDSPSSVSGEKYKTWGNYLYGVIGIGFTHRFFANAQDLGICFEYHTSGSVRQNQTFESYGTFVLKATYSFNVFPNKTSVKNLRGFIQ